MPSPIRARAPVSARLLSASEAPLSSAPGRSGAPSLPPPSPDANKVARSNAAEDRVVRSGSPRRVLLTGASGYVGQHVAREFLTRGARVTAVVRDRERLGRLEEAVNGGPGDGRGLTPVHADLERDTLPPGVFEGHDLVVHAALIWGEEGTELDLRDTAAVARVFDAAGRAGVPRGVYVSSVAVHRPFAAEMGEDDRLAPPDLYGATKAAGELFLRAACAAHGMTGITVRAGPVVGPPAFPGGPLRSDHRLAAIVAAAREGRPIEVEGGRQWTSVTSLATTIHHLATAPDPHDTYVVVDREITPWAWIARAAVATLGSSSAVHERPAASPRFRTDRIDALLGGPTDARPALLDHLHALAG